MLTKIAHHLRNGTFLSAVRRKLRGNRPPSADPDHYRGEVAKDYLKKRLKQEMWHREQSVVAQLLDDVKDGSSVLDIAIGTGRFVEMYLAKNMSVHGIDISQDMLDAAAEELGDSYAHCEMKIGSADALPYGDHEFDLVMCFRFFGLIPMDMGRRVLAEMHRVARDRAILRVPIRSESASPVAVIDDDQPLQGRLYDRDAVALFSEHGFDVRERHSLGEKGHAHYLVYVLEKRQTD